MTKLTVLFDCDGTLVDSEIIAMGVAIDILADAVQALKSGVEINRPALVQEFAGWHFHKMIPEMEKRHGVILDHSALDALKKPSTLTGLSKVAACAGIVRYLEDAERHGHSIALVTSSEFDRVNLCLDMAKISRFFPEDRKFSANDTLPEPKHKPDPAIYHFALKALKLRPEEAVAVEDSKSGVSSAVAAKIPVIGYTGASHIPDAGKEDAAKVLLSHGAAIVISHLNDLKAAIEYVENPSSRPAFQHPFYTPAEKQPVVLNSGQVKAPDVKPS